MGTASGFLVGTYIPIGVLPDSPAFHEMCLRLYCFSLSTSLNEEQLEPHFQEMTVYFRNFKEKWESNQL